VYKNLLRVYYISININIVCVCVYIYISLILCKRYLSSINTTNTSTLPFKQLDKVQGLYIPLNHSSKELIIFYHLITHTLILKAFIINKQEIYIYIYISLILCKRYLSSINATNTSTSPFKQLDKVQGLYNRLNHSSKELIIFYHLITHTLILKTFIINKQEQIFLFLEFKVHSLIYCNSLLKIIDFIIREFLNPIKRDCFTSVRSSITSHKLCEFLKKKH
jgi:hypothetical protein